MTVASISGRRARYLRTGRAQALLAIRVQQLPCPSFDKVFPVPSEARRGDVGMVPVENSTEGRGQLAWDYSC